MVLTRQAFRPAATTAPFHPGWADSLALSWAGAPARKWIRPESRKMGDVCGSSDKTMRELCNRSGVPTRPRRSKQIVGKMQRWVLYGGTTAVADPTRRNSLAPRRMITGVFHSFRDSGLLHPPPACFPGCALVLAAQGVNSAPSTGASERRAKIRSTPTQSFVSWVLKQSRQRPRSSGKRKRRAVGSRTNRPSQQRTHSERTHGGV